MRLSVGVETAGHMLPTRQAPPCGHGRKCGNLSRNRILPALLAKTGKRWKCPVKRRQKIPNPAEARAWTINLNSFQNGATAAAALQHAFVVVAVTPSTPAPKPGPAVSFKSQPLPFIVNQAKARTSVWAGWKRTCSFRVNVTMVASVIRTEPLVQQMLKVCVSQLVISTLKWLHLFPPLDVLNDNNIYFVAE